MGVSDSYARGRRLVIEQPGLLVVGLITQELALFYVAVVRGELRVGETAPIEFTRRLLWVTVAVTLLHSGWGVDGILVGHICGRAVEFLWAYHRSETPIGRPSLDRIRSLVAFSKYQSVMALGGRAYQWMDVLIIGFFLSGRFVSAYEVAWQVTLLVLLLSKSIERSLFPQISQWDADAARARIESTVSRALGSVLFVSIPALVGAVLYAEVVLSTFFGPECVIASAVLVILMAEKLCQSYNDIVGMSIRALDRPDLTARATALSVGLNLLLSPLLVVTIGFEGAAIATTVSWLVHAVLQTRYMARFVSFSYPVRLVCWYGVASVGMAGVLVVLRSVVPADGIVTLLFQVTVGICVYLLFSAAIPAVREQVLWPGLAVVRG